MQIKTLLLTPNAACAMAVDKLPHTLADPSLDWLLSSLQVNDTNDDMVKPILNNKKWSQQWWLFLLLYLLEATDN
jgi:hypothetical protein